MKGVVGLPGPGNSVSVRFLYREGNAVEALREIEKAEQNSRLSCFPELIGAVLAAIRARRYPVTLAPSVIATLSGLGPGPGVVPISVGGDPGHRETDRLAEQFVRSIVDADGVARIPAGMVSRARFWISVAVHLWDSQSRAFLRKHVENLDDQSLFLIAGLSAAALEAGWVQEITVAGTHLDVRSISPEDMLPALFQALELEECPPAVFQFIAGGNVFPAQVPSTVLVEPLRSLYWTIVPDPGGKYPPTPLTIADRYLAQGIVHSLLTEAETGAVYVPAGKFEVVLPPEYPLARYGVTALRVWAEPDGLWVGLVGRRIGPCFRWTPTGKRMVGLVIREENLRQMVDVTLAALWHDLRVPGPDAFPDRREGWKRTERSDHAGNTRDSRSSIRVLPGRIRPRQVLIEGKRMWGSEEDRRQIRRSHGVRGHLRRLHSGWTASLQAREMANRFGIVIPDGYTFVRPHTRGGNTGEGDGTRGTRVRATGLASVMHLLVAGDVNGHK